MSVKMVYASTSGEGHLIRNVKQIIIALTLTACQAISAFRSFAYEASALRKSLQFVLTMLCNVPTVPTSRVSDPTASLLLVHHISNAKRDSIAQWLSVCTARSVAPTTIVTRSGASALTATRSLGKKMARVVDLPSVERGITAAILLVVFALQVLMVHAQNKSVTSLRNKVKAVDRPSVERGTTVAILLAVFVLRVQMVRVPNKSVMFSRESQRSILQLRTNLPMRKTLRKLLSSLTAVKNPSRLILNAVDQVAIAVAMGPGCWATAVPPYLPAGPAANLVLRSLANRTWARTSNAAWTQIVL